MVFLPFSSRAIIGLVNFLFSHFTKTDQFELSCSHFTKTDQFELSYSHFTKTNQFELWGTKIASKNSVLYRVPGRFWYTCSLQRTETLGGAGSANGRARRSSHASSRAAPVELKILRTRALHDDTRQCPHGRKTRSEVPYLLSPVPAPLPHHPGRRPSHFPRLLARSAWRSFCSEVPAEMLQQHLARCVYPFTALVCCRRDI